MRSRKPKTIRKVTNSNEPIIKVNRSRKLSNTEIECVECGSIITKNKRAEFDPETPNWDKMCEECREKILLGTLNKMAKIIWEQM
jgi:hypothetical protein